MARDYDKLFNDTREKYNNNLLNSYIEDREMYRKVKKSTFYQYLNVVINYIKYISEVKNIDIEKIDMDVIEKVNQSEISNFVFNNNGDTINTQKKAKDALKNFYKFLCDKTDYSNKEIMATKTIIEEKIKPNEQLETQEDLDNAVELAKIKKNKKTNKQINTDVMNLLIANIESKRNNEQAIRDLCIVCTMFALGIRRSEASAINVGDVDFENNIIYIKSMKKSKVFDVELPKELKIIIAEYLKSEFYINAKSKSKEKNNPLFYSTRTFNRISDESITKLFKKYGVEDFTSHAFRKYGITKEYIITGDMHQASVKGGHSSFVLTSDTYITDEAKKNIGKYKDVFDGIKIKLLEKYYIKQECLGGKVKDEKEQ